MQWTTKPISIAHDGEFILDNDDVTMKVRVAGKPPTVVKGKLAAWETLVGELAMGVLDVTQPAVVTAYLGIKAETREDLVALSKRLRWMSQQDPKLSGAVMSVAYDAYGNALLRQGKTIAAQAAFDEAMVLDATNGVAVINAANLENSLRDYNKSSALYLKAQGLRLPAMVKAVALQRRIAGATNAGDCVTAQQALKAAKASPYYYAPITSGAEAIYMTRCEFEEARAVALIERNAKLHPDASAPMTSLAVVYLFRPEKRYFYKAIETFQIAIENGVEDPQVYNHLASALAERGDYEASRLIMQRRAELLRKLGTPIPSMDEYEGRVYLFKRDYVKANVALNRYYSIIPPIEELDFLDFAATRVGLERYDEATKIYNDGLTRFSRSCWLWEAFGRMYATKGEVATALATFDKGIAAVPKCGLNYNEAARLLLKQNRVPEAKQKLDTLIKIAPNSDGAVIAKEILATIP